MAEKLTIFKRVEDATEVIPLYSERIPETAADPEANNPPLEFRDDPVIAVPLMA